MGVTDELRRALVDRHAVQLDAFTRHRHKLVEPLIAAGPIRSLNIGTGGGVETLAMLRKGNQVTTIEIDDATAARTRDRIERNGYGDQHRGVVGHVMEVALDEAFDQIMMCEVLEHVMDDAGTLRRLAGWLVPGGRLVLSTPTASYGMLPGDTLSVEEDGGHVRVGYEGPELDAMLDEVGLTTVQRVYNSHLGLQWLHLAERGLRRNRATRPLGYGLSLVARPFTPVIDRWAVRPNDQITLAVKQKHAGNGTAA